VSKLLVCKDLPKWSFAPKLSEKRYFRCRI